MAECNQVLRTVPWLSVQFRNIFLQIHAFSQSIALMRHNLFLELNIQWDASTCRMKFNSLCVIMSLNSSMKANIAAVLYTVLKRETKTSIAITARRTLLMNSSGVWVTENRLEQSNKMVRTFSRVNPNWRSLNRCSFLLYPIDFKCSDTVSNGFMIFETNCFELPGEKMILFLQLIYNPDNNVLLLWKQKCLLFSCVLELKCLLIPTLYRLVLHEST